MHHECVTVPSVGGFVLEHKASHWDRERNVVYPPSVVVRFNEALDHQDGLLVEQYASSLGISLRRAKLELEKDIKYLRAELLHTRSYRMEGIGVLALEVNGLLHFSPNPSMRISRRYYGLGSMIAPKYVGDGLSMKKEEADDRGYIQIKIPKRALRYTMVAGMLLLVGGLPIAVWKPKVKSAYEASLAPNPKAFTQITKQQEPKVEPVKPVVVEQKVEPKQPLWVDAEKGRYYVIIGSEHTESIAKKYAEASVAKYPSLVILRGRKVFRISVADYANSAEAYAHLKRLDQEGVPAWVYIAR